MRELNNPRKGSGRTGIKNLSRCTIPFGTINRIPKPTIFQLARRGGAECSSTLIRQEVYYALNNFIVNVLHDAMIHTTGEQRNTVTMKDITYALTRRGHLCYGFNT